MDKIIVKDIDPQMKTIDKLTNSGALSRFLPALCNFGKYGNKSITGFRFDRENDMVYFIRDNGEEEGWKFDELYKSQED